jgi:hypothetical protein
VRGPRPAVVVLRRLMADALEGVNNLGHCAFRTDTRDIDIMAKLNTDARKELPATAFAEQKKPRLSGGG